MAIEQRVASNRAVMAEARRAKPVKWWASIGALMLGLQAYVYTAWIVSGNATSTPHGPDKIPTGMLVAIRTQEVLCPIGMLLFMYFFLIKPWRRDRRISLDGLFVLCMLFMYWMDPLVNYTQNFATYNSHFLNLGSWSQNIPGWLAPNSSKFSEPLLWAGPTYVWALFGGVLLSNIAMQRAKARWPQLGTFGLIMTCFAFFFVVDFVLEILFMRLGVYTYAGSVGWLSLFSGHYYQFPVYEALLWGATWAGFGCVRYFRNDKGQTAAERGIDELRATQKQKTFVRFLALLGLLSTIFMAYNVSWAWVSLHQDAWPKDITNRSYLTDYLCGDGTTYACPGPSIPIPRPESAHVGPDGKLQSANR